MNIAELMKHYPFVKKEDILYTIIYSILFWTVIGLSSITMTLLFPLLIFFTLVSLLFYRIRYKDFPDEEELEKYEDEILHRKNLSINYHHYNDVIRFHLNGEIYETKLHSLRIDCDYKKADVLVILHGVNSSATLISNIYKYLSKCFHVYAIDVPGFGRSNIVNKDGNLLYHQLGILYYNKIIENYLRIKNLKNVILMGHSFGGFIAGNYCIQVKERVKQLILVEPAGLFPFFSKYGAPLAFFFKNARAPNYLGNIGMILGDVLSSFTDDKYCNHYNYVVGHYPGNNWGKKLLADFITLDHFGGNWNYPIISKLIRIDMPFHVIYGDNDFIIGSHERFINKLFPDSCSVLKNCGHSPFLHNDKMISKEIINATVLMKNRRKHTKYKPHTIEENILADKYLNLFKSTFNIEQTQKMQDILYKKYYLL